MRRPGSARTALAAVALAVVPSACVEPDPYDGYSVWPPYGENVAELTIDAGEGLLLEPGEGVGVGVEYAGEGRWAVTTVCDSSLSDVACIFDVFIASDESVTEVDGSDLESDDDVYSPDRFAVQLEFVTDTDSDGASFTTSPGATVRVSALLYDPVPDSAFDWSDDPRMLSWVGNGAIHRGAPTNPVDLSPSRP